MNREQWLDRLVALLRPMFADANLELPDEIAISCGWPTTGATSIRNRTLGQCFPPSLSQQERPEIFISPVLDDSIEVGAVVVHELLHAALPSAKHGPAFKRAMPSLGLEGKPTATVPSETLSDALSGLVEQIGESYPHGSLDPSQGRSKQSTRMIKLQCSACGYVLRTTRKWIETGLPLCCCGSGSFEHDLQTDTEQDEP